MKLKTIALTLSILFGHMLVAQEEKLPGNTTLPSSQEEMIKLSSLDDGDYDYSVSDYFARPKQSSFRFSPDGKYFSYREKDENAKRHVYVKNTETDKVQKIIEEGEELIRGYGWANNERLLYIKDEGGDENYQLFAVDLDGSNPTALTPYEDVRVEISEILKDAPDHIIVEMNIDNKQIFEPYKLNIITGEKEKLFENKDAANPISGYSFDKDGNLRGYSQQRNGIEYDLFYKNLKTGEFAKVLTTDWSDDFGIIDFDYTSDNPNLAYVISNLTSNTNEIQLYDFGTNKVIETVFSHPTFDAGGMSTSRKRNYEVDYFYYNGEKSQTVPVSEKAKKFVSKFEKEFGNKSVSVTSSTDEEDKYLLYVYSDKLYGSYYLYNATDESFKKLLDLMPQLKEEDMAEMRSIKFTTRDGLEVYGYITVPNNITDGKKVPMIVNPHGGPYGPRDDWGFNPETQLFASRGYATLQINYRGSGGYGKSFYLAGSKQIGRNMLNDLEDGVAHILAEGWVDKDRIAIYGGSYGGLATLGSLVKTPDLYTCGIDYVGVSNLFTFYKSFPEYWKPYLKQVFAQWYDPNIEEEKLIMEQVSPALNADKITKPLMVVQGANDPRVNIDESDQVVSNLRARGIEVPYMVKYNEGHGFGHEENRIELYEAMLGFFAKHLNSIPTKG